MVAMRVVSPTGNVLYYLHGDHLGSVSLITNGAGAIVAQQLYAPYGVPRWISGTLPTDVGFTGQRADATGLMFYNARYYSPQLGRFVSADTIIPNPIHPQLFNRYSYAGNNPVLYNDPDGHCGPLCVVGLIIFLGGIVLSVRSDVAQPPGTFPEDDVSGRLGESFIFGDVVGDPITLVTGHDPIWDEDVPYFSAEWNKTAGLVVAPVASRSLVRGISKLGEAGDALRAGKKMAETTDKVKLVGHHTIPREILEKYLPKDVADAVRGKKGAPNIWDIPEEVHKKIHAGPGGGRYNERWIEEIRKLEKITPEAVVEIRDRLVKEFGLDPWRP